jgi:hypothetical protein
MGGGGSTTIKQNLNMSMLNEMMYSSVVNNTTSTTNIIENIQGMKINIKNNIGCKIIMEQAAEASIMSQTEQIVNNFQSIENELVSAMQSQVSGALDKQTQMGNLQFGDRQNVEQNINNEIKNIVHTELETNNLTETVNKAINIQDGEINIDNTICPNSEELVFKQNISADIAAQTVSQNILSATTNNKVINETITETEAKLTTKAGGAAEVVDSIGSAFAGPMIAAAIVSVVCVVVLMIGMVALGKSPAGQKAMNSAASRAFK